MSLHARFLTPWTCVCLAGWACTSPAFAGPGKDDRDAPSEHEASFRLVVEQYTVTRGQTIEVRLAVSCDEGMDLLTWSIEFDRERLEFLGSSLDSALDFGPEASLESFHDEGEDWTQGVLEVREPDEEEDHEGEEGDEDEEKAEKDHRGGEIHAGIDQPVVILTFLVKADAPEGVAEFRLTEPEDAHYEGHLHDGEENIYNSSRRRGRGRSGPGGSRFEDAVRIEVIDSPLRISILGDVALFSRGDVNGDGLVDVSDPIAFLDYLFLDGPEPPSPFAADTNGDGEIDLADVLKLLVDLFMAPPEQPGPSDL